MRRILEVMLHMHITSQRYVTIFHQLVQNFLYVSFLIAISFSTFRYCFTNICHPGIVKLCSFSLQLYM